MASPVQISEYFAKFGFKIDTASVTTLKDKIKEIKEYVSKTLDVKVKISKFTISKRDLNSAIKQAITEAGGIKLAVNSFAVNATELRKSVQEAFDKGVTLRVNATTKTKDPRVPSTRQATGGGGKYDPAVNVLSRYGLRAIPAYASIMGTANINAISEDIQSSKMSLNTITGGRGVEAYQWLKNQGNQLGFDFRNQLPVFSGYLGAAINKQGYEQSLQSFKDLSTYGLTHGADKVSMERAMLAIGQMWSKGKIMGEELNQQLAEAKGFSGAKQIFAAAWQEKIGGKLTGQQAEAALIDAMKKGIVMSADVMPIVTRMMGQQASGGIQALQSTTGFQHARFTNAITNAVEVFGKGGFDEGMMRFFKFMADFLDRHSEDIRELGKSFLTLEKTFEKIVNVGEGVFGFINKLNPSLTTLGLILAPIVKVLGKFGMAITAISLAMDDLSTYLSGGDSMLGRFINYMKDLTGMDLSKFSTGLAAVGLAVTAAFSPMIAFIASLGILLEMYKYTQGLKQGEGVDPSSNTLPTWQQMNTQNAKSGLIGQLETMTGGYEGGGWNIDKSKGSAILLGGTKGKEYRPVLQKYKNAFDAGEINQDQLDRALTAAGAGYSSVNALSNWIDMTLSRRNNPNIFPASALPELNVTINGTFENKTFNLKDLIAQVAPKDGPIKKDSQ